MKTIAGLIVVFVVLAAMAARDVSGETYAYVTDGYGSSGTVATVNYGSAGTMMYSVPSSTYYSTSYQVGPPMRWTPVRNMLWNRPRLFGGCVGGGSYSVVNYGWAAPTWTVRSYGSVGR